MPTQADHWNQRYDRDDFFYGSEPNDFLREMAPRLPAGGRVLCLAEGEGRNATFLAGLGMAVTAVDLSEVGLAKARRLAGERGLTIETQVADLADFAIEPEAWDGIVSIWCHLPAPLRREVHRRAVAGLRPGGVFILEAYTPRQLMYRTGGPPVAELMMELGPLQRELAELQWLVGHEIERTIQEGTGHAGRSAVVQVAARKRP